MSDPKPFRRRIDRVVAEDYLDDLTELNAADLRVMRDECREEEARLSYARRLLHGQLDIAKAELTRRDDDVGQSLVEDLGDILSDQPHGGTVRSVGNAEIYSPSGPLGRRRGDAVLDEMPMGRLPDLSNEELITVVRRLAEEEAGISQLRQGVLDHLDTLQNELIGRYRDGGASVDEILPPTAST